MLYGSSVLLFLLYFVCIQLHKMPGRNRIPIEHRERMVRAFEDEDEVVSGRHVRSKSFHGERNRRLVH